MKNFASAFRNKKVFITGHTGFKGSWLCVWLQMMGAEVKGYSLKAEKESLYKKIEHGLKIKSVTSNILDKEKIRREIISFQPDFIFHLAAQSLVRKSYEVPVETFDTNVIGTAHILDALRYVNKKCVCVVVTTDKVYQNIEKDYAYKETDQLGGYDPYSASKAAAEIIVESFRLSFFNPEKFSAHKKSIGSVRAGNVIGGGDYAKDRIVPDIFRALSKSEPVNIRNPKAIRPWQHVLEPLSGYLTLAAAMSREPKMFSSSFNFGPQLKDTNTVEELVNFAIKCWGGGKYNLVKQINTPHEASILKLNISKAESELDWKPKWNSEEAIEHTIKWYKNSLNKNCDIMELCIADIKEYLSK
jgi:CDP-glucose 4,6-dehydratase